MDAENSKGSPYDIFGSVTLEKSQFFKSFCTKNFQCLQVVPLPFFQKFAKTGFSKAQKIALFKNFGNFEQFQKGFLI